MICRKCNIVLFFQNAEYTVFARKNMLMISKKNQQNMTEYCKNAILSVYHAGFGGYHPV